ncbi:MAG: hypothetical protein NVSMB64_25560 [Candidatus Velthaea sp.]
MHLERIASHLTAGLEAVFTRHGVPHTTARAGSMFGFFFTKGPVRDLPSAKTADTALFGKFFHGMLDRGIYLAPSQFEAGFIAAAHTEAHVDRTLRAADETLASLLTGAHT